jgi:hypothetical protein
MTVPVVIRRYSGDEQQHAYLAADVTQDWEFAAPMCRLWPYPCLHPRGMVSRIDLPAFGGVVDRCPGCAVWTRQNPHTVVVRSEVATS